MTGVVVQYALHWSLNHVTEIGLKYVFIARLDCDSPEHITNNCHSIVTKNTLVHVVDADTINQASINLGLNIGPDLVYLLRYLSHHGIFISLSLEVGFQNDVSNIWLLSEVK